jgi:hypothetical protein
MAKRAHIITLHVSIDLVVPPVWRRIEVDADITLRNLHHILQAAFGWTTSHLHEFEIEHVTYAMLDDEYLHELIEVPYAPPLDDRKTKLGRLVYRGQRFIYLYDFAIRGGTRSTSKPSPNGPRSWDMPTSRTAPAPALQKTSAARMVIGNSSRRSSADLALRKGVNCSIGLAVSSMPTCLTSVLRMRLCYGWPQTGGERNRLLEAAWVSRSPAPLSYREGRCFTWCPAPVDSLGGSSMTLEAPRAP